jgi:sulfoxide reductase heme-binding subunit YedZ
MSKWWLAPVTAAAMAAVVLAQAAGFEATPWYVTRGAGLVAFALLTVSMALGLLISSKESVLGLPKRLVFELHQSLSGLALYATALHATVLLFDRYVPFSPVQVLLPFASGYETVGTGLGIAGMWAMATVLVSSAARRRIGQRAWRRLHFLSFMAYGMALAHAPLTGTDGSVGGVKALYIVSAAVVGGLLAFRAVLGVLGRRRRGPTPAGEGLRLVGPASRRGAAVT